MHPISIWLRIKFVSISTLIFPRDLSSICNHLPSLCLSAKSSLSYRYVYPPEIQSFIKVRCITMIEILWDARVSTFKFLRGRSPNRKVWFKQERWWPLCLPVDLRKGGTQRAVPVERSGLTGAKLHRHGPTFPPTWRIYFTAVSDTLIPGSFRGAFRFASTDFRIVQCFEFTGVSRGPSYRVRRTGRDTRSDRSVVKASKSLNVVSPFAVKVTGEFHGTSSFYQFPDKRQRLSCRFGNFLPKIRMLRFHKLFSFVILTSRDVSKYSTFDSYKLEIPVY